MESKKITKKDLEVIKAKIEVDCIIIDNKPINLSPVAHSRIENYITHVDCDMCGLEFKKRYDYESVCASCKHKEKIDKYNAMPLVEWDGESYLFDYLSDDKYFSDADEILDYCEDNEIEPKDLMLVECTSTNFSQLDFDIWADDVHEDWEPSTEFQEKLKEFNDFLSKKSTNTWFPSKKRVDITELLTNKN